MSGFQTSVAFYSGLGVPGDIIADVPRRAQSWILNSALASYNVFGSAFSVSSQGVAQAGNPGGTAVFAGILVDSKAHALIGSGGNPLAPTLQLGNGAQADLLTEGSCIIQLPAGAAIGDLIVADQTTGALSTIAPTASLPAGKFTTYGYVDYFTVGAAGLAVGTFKQVYAPAVA